MALVAYLMEHKNNYGPHLIIVPNAVMVNWKSELTQWLPSVRCVYYVGHKDERARKFATEVASLQFNVLVTTYEYIMRDRAKLSKVGLHFWLLSNAVSETAGRCCMFVSDKGGGGAAKNAQTHLRCMQQTVRLQDVSGIDIASCGCRWTGST